MMNVQQFASGSSYHLLVIFAGLFYIYILQPREDWKLRGPRSSSFWVPGNLSNHMDRQARTSDTVLVRVERWQEGAKHCSGGWGGVGVSKSREMTGRSQTLQWWLGGSRGKDHRKQNTLAPAVLGIRIRSICIFLGLPDPGPDPLVRGMDPDLSFFS